MFFNIYNLVILKGEIVEYLVYWLYYC